MKRNTRTLGILALAGGVVAAAVLLSAQSAPRAGAVDPVASPPKVVEEGKIQIALLLDTSSSMSGLIDQARSQLWKMVNEISSAERAGKRPHIELALYEYGHSALDGSTGFIRQISPLTTDLDSVSEQLFALSTNGGEEYCPWVIRTATQQLAWSDNPRDLKVIFIAGNEPFNQGPVSVQEALSAATAKGISVHTVHCGDVGSGVAGGWRAGALAGGGEFMSIDQNAKVVHVAAPQDDEITRLGLELNQTYVAYGKRGKESSARQAGQDQNAVAAAQGASVQRAVTKASGAYDNSQWDLVDAKKKGIDVGMLSKDELPAEIADKPAEERRAYVEAKAAERGRLKQRIAELDAERQKFVQAEQARAGAAGETTLDSAMTKAVKGRAEKSGWTFKKK